MGADPNPYTPRERVPRRRGDARLSTPASTTSVPVERVWPPDPEWGTDDRGRFYYRDYDGESLHVWRDKEGELWIDKRGEGPVYVRAQDATLILGAVEPPPVQPVYKTREEMAAFAKEWDAKVDAGRQQGARIFLQGITAAQQVKEVE